MNFPPHESSVPLPNFSIKHKNFQPICSICNTKITNYIYKNYRYLCCRSYFQCITNFDNQQNILNESIISSCKICGAKDNLRFLQNGNYRCIKAIKCLKRRDKIEQEFYEKHIVSLLLNTS
jgi:hypothetical protein